MANPQRELSGILFKNNRKEKDTHPDRTGEATIGGIEYWVSGWVKKDKNGDPFLSLAFKEKVARDDQRPAPTTQARPPQQPAQPQQEAEEPLPF